MGRKESNQTNKHIVLLVINRQQPFLNQRKEENDRRNYFMINHHESLNPCICSRTHYRLREQPRALLVKFPFFKEIFHEYDSECKIVWIQIRPDVLRGLIWVQKPIDININHHK